MQRSRFLGVMGAFAAVAASLPLVGCGGGESTGTAGPVPAPPSPAPAPSNAPPPLPAATGQLFAYAANSESNDISIYKVLTSGALDPVDTVPAGSGAATITVHPSGRFAYAVNEGASTVSAYAINAETGLLEALEPFDTFPAAGSPEGMHIHPSGQFAYLTVAGNSILIYGIAGDGALVDGRTIDMEAEIGGVALDPSGNLLYVASRASAKISSYTINASGDLAPRSSIDTGVFPSEIAVAPSGDALYVATGMNICTHAISLSGELGPASSVEASNVDGLAVAASGKFVYAVTSNGVAPEVSVYEVVSTGALSLRSSASADAGGSLALHPSGGFLYMANYGADTVSVYTVNQDTGALARMPPSVPAGLSIDHICIARVAAIG